MDIVENQVCTERFHDTGRIVGRRTSTRTDSHRAARTRSTRHFDILAIIANNQDLLGTKALIGTKGEDHARSWFVTMARVICGHKVEKLEDLKGGKTRPGGGDTIGRGDAQPKTPGAECGKEMDEVADWPQVPKASLMKTRVDGCGELQEGCRGRGQKRSPDLSDVEGGAGGQRATRGDAVGEGIMACNAEKERREGLIASRDLTGDEVIGGDPGGRVVDQGAILVEDDAAKVGIGHEWLSGKGVALREFARKEVRLR
jgi:hypothetical protein